MAWPPTMRGSICEAPAGHAHIGGKRHLRSAAQHSTLERRDYRLLDIADGGLGDHSVAKASCTRILGE